MDDETSTTTTTRTLLVVAAGLLLLALPARDAFGDRGVEAVLLLVLAVLAVLAFFELTGRPYPRLRGAAAVASAAPEPPDEWRSERWVREAVERGLHALDEWRLEQREA